MRNTIYWPNKERYKSPHPIRNVVAFDISKRENKRTRSYLKVTLTLSGSKSICGMMGPLFLI